jgi:hypothetical protein
MSRCKEAKRCLWLMVIGSLFLCGPAPAWAQFGDIYRNTENKIRKAVNGKTNTSEKTAPAQQGGAAILFSKSPINPAVPADLATAFKAGDPIYALIQTAKTWRDLLGKGNANLTEIQVPIDMIVAGETVDFQYITIKNAQAIDGRVLVLDIAPDPAKMTAYKDADFAYGEGKGNRKIGPDQYTYNLSKLKPGKHTVKFQVRSYGKIFSAGELTIEGDDFKTYADLREKILKVMLNVGGMPKSQKTDAQLAAQMMKLLQNAGWKNIRRLNIVDKDWWNDLVSGGDSPVKGRHIAAAVAAKAADGSYFWANVTFAQQMLITGAFGPLELSHTGEKRPIKEENIDK